MNHISFPSHAFQAGMTGFHSVNTVKRNNGLGISDDPEYIVDADETYMHSVIYLYIIMFICKTGSISMCVWFRSVTGVGRSLIMFSFNLFNVISIVIYFASRILMTETIIYHD